MTPLAMIWPKLDTDFATDTRILAHLIRASGQEIRVWLNSCLFLYCRDRAKIPADNEVVALLESTFCSGAGKYGVATDCERVTNLASIT